MTLTASDYAEIMKLAQQVSAEMLRNMARGTGGAVVPLPTYRLATVGGVGGSGEQVEIKADGDLTPVVAINACSVVIDAGDRVLALWAPPHGVYVVNALHAGEKGEWTPAFTGTGVSNGNTTASGVWTRIGRRVHALGRAQLNVGGTWGSALSLAGLPFPTATYATGVHGIAAIGQMYSTSAGTSFPGQWIVGEGVTQGGLYTYGHFDLAGSVFLAQMSSAIPQAQAGGDYVTVDIIYEADI